MGIINQLREGIFRIRAIPKDSLESATSFTNEENNLINKVNDAIENGKRIDLSDLSNISSIKGTRNQKYEIFEEMIADGRIGAAVEMYANDTVQYNPEGKIIWVESTDSDVAKYANNLLQDLNIADNIWSYAYCLWLYGDLYLELFDNTSITGKKASILLEPFKPSNEIKAQKEIKGAKLERYIEKVANPAEVYDLQFKGKTAGFIRSFDDLENTLINNTYQYQGTATNLTVLRPTKYVHICLSPNINRFPEKFKLIKDEKELKTSDGYIDGSKYESAGGELTFTVKTGQSILENVYKAYQTLKLKEESVLLERITKASITRIIQVELGDLPEAQKRKKLQEIKNQIEQQLIMNKDAGSIQSRSGCQPIENIIYTTTKNGKGTISTVNIGGDVNIGDLGDVEDSENKVYGALLTPKALLGADMEGSGLSNGGSLTEMNTTYARRIKRGQMALINGIKTLINIFAISDGLGAKVVNNFEVKLTPIITVEDNRRDELLQTKIRNVSDILALLDKIESLDEETKLRMILNWLTKYLNQQEAVDIIKKRQKEIAKDDDDLDLEEIDLDDLDYDRDIDKTPSSFDVEDEEIPVIEKPDIPEEVNLADIEGEDLI